MSEQIPALPRSLGITKSGQLVMARSNNYFAAANPIKEVEAMASILGIPVLSNVGLSADIPKIPYDQWKQTVGFHRWAQKKYGKETHISHFITRDGNMITVPFHQEVVGMTIKIDLNTPENQALLAELEETYGIDVGGFHGTTHHHCTMSAFQSGTDKHDEDNQQGVHFTLGNMNSPTMSMHCRVSSIFNGDISTIVEGQPIPEEAKIAKSMVELSGVHLLNLFDIPEMDKNLHLMPKEYVDFAIKHYLTSLGEEEFPEEWKARVTEKKYTPQYQAGVVHQSGQGQFPVQRGNFAKTGLGAGQQQGNPTWNNISNAMQIKLHAQLQILFVLYEESAIGHAASPKEFMTFMLTANVADASRFCPKALPPDVTRLNMIFNNNKQIDDTCFLLSNVVLMEPETWNKCWQDMMSRRPLPNKTDAWSFSTALMREIPESVKSICMSLDRPTVS